jgi:hypothetical protein
MAKVKVRKVVVKCECSRCGQVAHVEPYNSHVFCRGFKVVKPLPALFDKLQGKNKGMWTPSVEMDKKRAIVAEGFLGGLAAILSMQPLFDIPEEIPSTAPTGTLVPPDFHIATDDAAFCADSGMSA